MAVNLNLENATRYIAALDPSKLGGLADVLGTKAAELDVKATRVKAQEDATKSTSGNVRSILRFIDSVTEQSSDEDKAKLAALLGAVQGKVAVPKPKLGKAAARRASRRGRAK